MEHAHDAIFVLGPEGRISEANREAEALLGLPRDQIIDQHISKFAPAGTGAVPEYVARFQQAVAAGGGRVANVVLRRSDGSPVEVDFSMSVNQIGGAATVLSIGRDVTERNRAGREIKERMALAAFAADSGAALVQKQDLRAMLQQCAEAMVRHLEPAFARIWTLDDAGDTLELQASAGLYTHLDGGHARVPVGRLKIGLIASERQPHLTNDVLHDPRVSDPAWARREGMVAFAGYPLVVGERLLGVMAMFARRPLSHTALDAMASVANEIALGIEGKRAEDERQRAQQRLDHVVFHNPAVLCSMRPAGDAFELKWISENVERLLGYTAAECLAPDWWLAQLHDDDRDRVVAELARIMTSGLVQHEYRFRHRDGRYRWVRAEIRLLRSVAGDPLEAVASWSDVTALKEAELRLQDSEQQYRLLFDSNPFPMAVIDQETLGFLAVNDASLRVYGHSREEFLRMAVGDVRVDEGDGALAGDYPVSGASDSATRLSHARKHRRKDGSVMEVEIARSRITFRGRPAWLAMVSDVTEKKSLEAQLVRAQKMEAVGQLAGGVAHDFNNLLGVITGYAELLSRELAPGSRALKRSEEITHAARRAAALTRQLLAFSRRQVLQPRVLDLNTVVADVEKMMRRLISENIQIVTAPAPGLGNVRADAGQLEQVLMNLAINARDAMPSGGRLVIETANVELDETYARVNPEARPGPHVVLAVSDTGHGMDARTMARIFEPFFTTKDEGKGTGLGLATVYGIVRQSGGTVNVYSEPGHGTTFKVYLPRVDAEGEADAAAPLAAPVGGSETILLVEDADALRLLVRELLEDAGYSILDAEAPDKALALIASTPGPIHLVLTDMVMPRMSGQEFAARLATLRPAARVVFMSGYSDQAVAEQGTLSPGALFLQKPFTMDALMRTVRRALDAEGARGTAPSDHPTS
jgi:PAS domain S-box-containing protein